MSDLRLQVLCRRVGRLFAVLKDPVLLGQLLVEVLLDDGQPLFKRGLPTFARPLQLVGALLPLFAGFPLPLDVRRWI